MSSLLWREEQSFVHFPKAEIVNFQRYLNQIRISIIKKSPCCLSLVSTNSRINSASSCLDWLGLGPAKEVKCRKLKPSKYPTGAIRFLWSWLALNYIYLQFSSRVDRLFGLSNSALSQPAGREASDARGVRPLSWLWWRPRMNQVMSCLRKRLKLFSERLMHESSHVLPWNLGFF